MSVTWRVTWSVGSESRSCKSSEPWKLARITPCWRQAKVTSKVHGCRTMIPVLQILTLLFMSIAMALSLAHALEFPGKLRLSRKDYETVQEIYYPGFTYGGASEGIGLLLLLILLLIGSWQGTAF